MKAYLKFNLNSYLNRDRKKYIFTWFTPILIILLISSVLIIYQVYDIYETNAIYNCEDKCTLDFYYQINESFTFDEIKINNKSYEITDIFYGIIELDNNNVGIQKISLNIKGYEGKNNEIVKLQILKNKEKIIKKIYEIIKER